MYSTLKHLSLALAAAAAAVTVGGCNSAPMQRAQNKIDDARSAFVARIRPSSNAVDSVMVDPMPDKAAELRGFQASTFVYPNGATLAYPTYGLNYEDRPKWLSSDYLYSLATPAIMAYDLFAMPVYMIAEPPTTAVAYHGGPKTPASMTLSPPLPPLPPAAITRATPLPEPQATPEAQSLPAAPSTDQPVAPAPTQPDSK